jgi:peptide/nickel transport system substrate-binding protein
VSSVPLFYEQALLSDAVWNETHWKDRQFDRLVGQAQAATGEEDAAELWHEIQTLQYEKGGYLVWSNGTLVDGLAKKVKGLKANSFANLGAYSYRDVWLEG